ncbi:hypothetical protein SPRG_05206 [Saprolegnia parasitica CBS 223.65]|uniref:histone acetyltransferase n=1 Tax=Saprolegnia parasitica (strain CBS 223.65) TaxID=695850 RepID=A0A067CT93_SAPPC|nr:hypothetical protein SPRG_05206 [Saprolegnia parasitica CBS 223.65]KDO30017.1 hypothetical protein SPRG_05206 [Saprolegnia parasitica CBS 223.65]|eukprot:XP_012199199.1 hypothetical protein SPRG_05206 [Saprolegnia parasitica CBS 223.65]
MAEVDAPAAKKAKLEASCSANDCITMRIVRSADELMARDGPTFHPAFTYHAFGKDELIYGYTGLRIELTFAAQTFDCLVEIQYDSQDDDAWDLFAKMQSSLPSGATQDKATFLKSLADSASYPPPGALVSSYRHNEQAFETYYSPLDARGQAYLDKMQKLSLWFIEGADDIDVSDARWSLYTMLHKRGDDDYTPLGYITMFTFNLPQRAMMTSKRICQVLVLPPYQRQGHGERLVAHIMAEARASDSIHEITVEDPVPGFARLRDVVDIKTCLAHGFFASAAALGLGTSTQKCTPADIAHVKKALKLTKLQVQRCYEMLKLRHVDRSNEDAYKAFRIEVKRRLHTQHAEDLEAASSADRKKALLANLYADLEAEYDAVLARAKLL